MKSKRKQNVRSLIKKLDKIFSLYIRKRYMSDNGYIDCFTCHRQYHFTEVDCGHYISRSRLSTRFDEQNNHPQCRKCNRFLDGNMDEYAISLKKRYGEDILDILNKRKWETKIYTIPELEELIKKYSGLLSSPA